MESLESLIAGWSIGWIDLQTPGQVRGGTEKLLVEVVAQSANGLGQHDAGSDGVTEGRQRHPRPAASDPGT